MRQISFVRAPAFNGQLLKAGQACNYSGILLT
jgi:hypothetical protein